LVGLISLYSSSILLVDDTNALHMFALPGRQTKWLWQFSRRGLVKEDEVKSKSATNQIWKIHATSNTAFDVWQTQAVNDCILNKN